MGFRAGGGWARLTQARAVPYKLHNQNSEALEMLPGIEYENGIGFKRGVRAASNQYVMGAYIQANLAKVITTCLAGIGANFKTGAKLALKENKTVTPTALSEEEFAYDVMQKCFTEVDFGWAFQTTDGKTYKPSAADVNSFIARLVINGRAKNAYGAGTQAILDKLETTVSFKPEHTDYAPLKAIVDLLAAKTDANATKLKEYYKKDAHETITVTVTVIGALRLSAALGTANRATAWLCELIGPPKADLNLNLGQKRLDVRYSNPLPIGGDDVPKARQMAGEIYKTAQSLRWNTFSTKAVAEFSPKAINWAGGAAYTIQRTSDALTKRGWQADSTESVLVQELPFNTYYNRIRAKATEIDSGALERSWVRHFMCEHPGGMGKIVGYYEHGQVSTYANVARRYALAVRCDVSGTTTDAIALGLTYHVEYELDASVYVMSIIAAMVCDGHHSLSETLAAASLSSTKQYDALNAKTVGEVIGNICELEAQDDDEGTNVIEVNVAENTKMTVRWVSYKQKQAESTIKTPAQADKASDVWKACAKNNVPITETKTLIFDNELWRNSQFSEKLANENTTHLMTTLAELTSVPVENYQNWLSNKRRL